MWANISAPSSLNLLKCHLCCSLYICLIAEQVLSGSSAHLRSTPPNNEALRHSGGDSLLWTSPTVTLYLDVELRRDRRPGTEQKTSAGLDTPPRPKPSLPKDKTERAEPFNLEGTGTRARKRQRQETY